MIFVNENLIYWALILALLMMILLWISELIRERLLKNFGNINLLKKFSPADFKGRRIKNVILILVVFLIMLSLARPQWGHKVQKIVRKGIDIMILLDVSKSMLAEDVHPNRLEYAKYEIRELINRLKGDRIGLIVFAGRAFFQCPLTTDYAAFKMYLDIVNVNTVPIQGTNIGDAIIKALKVFPSTQKKYKVIILLTDGEDHEGEVEKALKIARKMGVIIYTVGIGTPNGELIPIRDSSGRIIGYKKDKNGNPVLSRLDEITLQRIALQTGGKYYRSDSGGEVLSRIYDDILKMERRKIYGTEFSRFYDRFQWFLLPAILLLILEILLKEQRYA